MVNDIQSRRSSVCVWELRPLNLVTKNSLFCPVSPQSEQLHFTTRGKDRGREGEIAAAERLNNSFGFRQANQTSLSPLPPTADGRRATSGRRRRWWTERKLQGAHLSWVSRIQEPNLKKYNLVKRWQNHGTNIVRFSISKSGMCGSMPQALH